MLLFFSKHVNAMNLCHVTKIAPNKYQNFGSTKSVINLLEEA